MKKKTIPVVALSSFVIFGTIFPIADLQEVEAEPLMSSIEFTKPVLDDQDDRMVPVNLYEYPTRVPEWQKLGYSSIYEYKNEVEAKREEYQGISDAAASAYSSVITDDERNSLYSLEDRVLKANCFMTIEKLDKSINDILTACDERMPRSYSSSSYEGSYYTEGGSGVLTKSGGINWFNGRKETWYSQRVLPGGGLRIPGRYVHSDGTIRDENGYICVAASDLPYGSIVETSLGTGKVYDTGCAAGTTDIYVDW